MFMSKLRNHLKSIKINKDEKLLWASSFLLINILLIVKIIVVYALYKNLSPERYCFLHFLSDIYLFTLIGLFLTFIFEIKNKIIKYILNIIIIFIIILYYVDIFTIHYFIERETLFSIFQIAKYWWKWFTWIALIWAIALILLWYVIYYYLSCKDRFMKFKKIFSPKTFVFVCIITITIYTFEWLNARRLTHNLHLPEIKNVIDLNIETIKDLYNEDMLNINLKDYEEYIIHEQGQKKDLNIIIVFVESLSAIDSARLWWNNNIPYTDKIQESWLTFTDFIANGSSSILSHVSSFLWIPPLKDTVLEYKNMEPLPKILNNLWYKTIYVSTAELGFLNEREHLYKRWFQEVVWEEAFEDKQIYTFEAAPDWDLYEKTLEKIREQQWKYFIGLNTISFHTPYDCPYWETQEACLKYTDEKLYNFYTSLKDLDFFDNGLLIIVWDHRKREPVQSGEYDLFWESWDWRVVATIVWSWIEAWTINKNLTQHTDLYYSLKKLLWDGDITLDTFYNDIFSPTTNRNRWIIVNKRFIILDWNTYIAPPLADVKKNNEEMYSYYLTLKNYFLKESMIHKDLSTSDMKNNK